MDKPVTHAQVATFVPNLIGYTRFALLFACPYFVYSDTHWPYFIVCYGLSQLLDAVDGNAARYFNQCSRFGAALDMVCDRACNSLIFFALATLYPHPVASFCFLMCFILDFGSHWLQFQSTAFCKAVSHKGKNTKENFLVGLYYNNQTVFMTTCIGAEIGSISLFINAKWTYI